jgi:hypothetical protein
LYDTDRTREMVRVEVQWYKAHREILESDLIHGRRADARDLDWMLHVNPRGKEKGMLVVFNPLNVPITRSLRVPFHYTGLQGSVRIREARGAQRRLKLDRTESAEVPVQVAAQGMSWYVVE